MFDRAKNNTSINTELFKLSKFHICALKGYFNSRNKTNKCQYVKCVLSHIIHHQHVSIAVSTNIRVTYKNIRNPNSPSKCTSEPFDSTKNVSNCLYSQRISAYYILLKSDTIQFVKKHKNWVYFLCS